MEKVSLEKKENIFLHISTKIPKNFDIKTLRWSKTDLSKETKKLLMKYNLPISEAFVSTNFKSSRREVEKGTSANGCFWNFFVET